MVDPLQVSPRNGVSLAIIQARKGVAPEAVSDALGISAPVGPGWVSSADIALVGTGPGVWFAIAEDAAEDWADRLVERLEGMASVFDQSSGFVLLRIAGDAARRLLQAGASIDLDPSRFTVGDSAATMIGHINVLFWQVDDLPSFDLAFYRSYASSMNHWLETTAAAL